MHLSPPLLKTPLSSPTWLAGARPLSPALGLRVELPQLARLVATVSFATELRQALARHGVLVLATGMLEAATLAAVAKGLGRVVERPMGVPQVVGHAGIAIVAAPARPDGPPDSREGRAQVPHHDGMAAVRPPTHVLLHLRDAPEGAGSTWTDMRAAWASLPPALRGELGGLKAWHNPLVDKVDEAAQAPGQALAEAEARTGHLLPLVHTDTPDGRPALYLPLHRDSAIEGMAAPVARRLLAALWQHVHDCPQRCSAPYRSGELIVWDNRALLHDRSAWPAGRARESWIATVVANDRPVSVC